MRRNLTANQEQFARLVAIEDRNFTDAYKSAYKPKTATKKTINEGASRVANDSKVLARISELRSITAEDDATCQLMIKCFLVDTLEDEMLPTRTRLRASELLGRATGLFTQKVEVTQQITRANPLKELTIEELKTFIAEVKRREAIDGEVVVPEGYGH